METTKNQVGINLFRFGLIPLSIQPEIKPFKTTQIQFRTEQYPIGFISGRKKTTPFQIETLLYQIEVNQFQMEINLHPIEVSLHQLETRLYLFAISIFPIETGLFGFETEEK